MPQVTSKDGTQIAYEKSGHGPIIILVDGAMGHRGHFGGLALASALSKEFRVICYDRRGRGESNDTLPYAVDREIEDIEALIDVTGETVGLYGFSSGAVLSILATEKLRDKISKLAVLEPPFGENNEKSKGDMLRNSRTLKDLLKENKKSEAVSFFLRDMIPPEVLEDMKKSPGWSAMVEVAHTLAYDYDVMGDGAIPTALVNKVTTPTLILVGENSPAFKHTAVNVLANVMPNSRQTTIKGQMTSVPGSILAPLLIEFFKS